MSLLFPHATITRIGSALFQAIGAPADEAELAVRELVMSSLLGIDSHGPIRIPDYLDLAARGGIIPGAKIDVQYTSETTAIVDGGLNFGAVSGYRAIEAGIEIARKHRVAWIITRHCNHVGRLGAYVQAAAEKNLIALATCNSPVHGHFVLPFGGKEGRLATNPLAYGIPTSGDPILADISTSVAPEGKIRFYKNEGKAVPPGWILDAQGNPTTDPNQFYGPPRGGILPLGGSAGHKGFALSLLVELFGNVLAGYATDDPAVGGNGVCFLVLDPAAFGSIERFKSLVDHTIAYIKSSPPAPGFKEVLVPGELEFRTLRQRSREGIPLDEVTWQSLQEHARRLKVDIDGLAAR